MTEIESNHQSGSLVQPEPEKQDSTRSGKKPFSRILLRNLRNLAIGYLLVVIMLAFFQRKLIYVPSTESKLPAPAPGSFGDSVDDITTTTSDGLTLHGWHARSKSNQASETQKAAIFLHGNGGHRLHRYGDLELLLSLGIDVIIFDYRGYGENSGKPSEEGLSLDAEAAWNYATDVAGFDPKQLILFGESLGGGVAVRLAFDLEKQGIRPGGIVLRSTFSSLTDAASYHYPWLPVRTILIDRYPSVDRIGDVKSPLLMLHGDQDRIVPFEMGQRLFEAAADESESGIEKQFVTLSGAGHNNTLQVAEKEIRRALKQFFASIESTH